MVLTTLIALSLLYLAYRIIRNGFARPQSERLNVYGIVACVLVALYLVLWLSG